MPAATVLVQAEVDRAFAGILKVIQETHSCLEAVAIREDGILKKAKESLQEQRVESAGYQAKTEVLEQKLKILAEENRRLVEQVSDLQRQLPGHQAVKATTPAQPDIALTPVKEEPEAGPALAEAGSNEAKVAVSTGTDIGSVDAAANGSSPTLSADTAPAEAAFVNVTQPLAANTVANGTQTAADSELIAAKTQKAVANGDQAAINMPKEEVGVLTTAGKAQENVVTKDAPHAGNAQGTPAAVVTQAPVASVTPAAVANEAKAPVAKLTQAPVSNGAPATKNTPQAVASTAPAIATQAAGANGAQTSAPGIKPTVQKAVANDTKPVTEAAEDSDSSSYSYYTDSESEDDAAKKTEKKVPEEQTQPATAESDENMEQAVKRATPLEGHSESDSESDVPGQHGSRSRSEDRVPSLKPRRSPQREAKSRSEREPLPRRSRFEKEYSEWSKNFAGRNGEKFSEREEYGRDHGHRHRKRKRKRREPDGNFVDWDSWQAEWDSSLQEEALQREWGSKPETGTPLPTWARKERGPRPKACLQWCFRSKCQHGDRCPMPHPHRDGARRIRAKVREMPCFFKHESLARKSRRDRSGESYGKAQNHETKRRDPIRRKDTHREASDKNGRHKGLEPVKWLRGRGGGRRDQPGRPREEEKWRNKQQKW